MTQSLKTSLIEPVESVELPDSVEQPGPITSAIEASSSLSVLQVQAFQEKMYAMGERYERVLPWRYIDDAYAVLVSEVMLQQTQVSRVMRYWERFLALFPMVDALAVADTSLVLEQWQGLGYNRRALALKRCAEECSERFGGQLPREYEALIALPGIGPATAAGVRAFAYNEPGVYLETNVRTVFLHEFFSEQEGISDKELIPLVEATCPADDARGWYYALLDYGAHLKATLPNPSRRSKHHSKQSTFEGSRRQKRAELVRIVLAKERIAADDLAAELNTFEAEHGRSAVSEDEFASITQDLVREGFFKFAPACQEYFC